MVTALIIGLGELSALALAAVGMWLLVVRLRMLDLSGAVVVGLGAYVGVVTGTSRGWSLGTSVAAAALAGGLLTAALTAAASRVGRLRTTILTLAVAISAVAVFRAWPDGGGVVGFHAAPLLTGTDAGQLGIELAALLAAVVFATYVGAQRWTSGARLRASTPVIADALAVPVRVSWVVGGVSGLLLGVAGFLLATATGSVSPGVFDLRLATLLLLAPLVGEQLRLRVAARRPSTAIWAVIGAVILWGPATAFPLVPVISDAPILVLGLLVIALGWHQLPPLAPSSPGDVGIVAVDSEPPRSGKAPLELALRTALSEEGPVRTHVRAGEVVLVAGGNGSGKSTLLARLGGQLPSDADSRVLPNLPQSARALSRAGVARTWQTIGADVDVAAAAHWVLADAESRAAAAWALSMLPGTTDTMLLLAVAQRPTLLLLDEPEATNDLAAVSRLVRALAGAGATVAIATPTAESAGHSRFDADHVVTLDPRMAAT